MLSAIPTSRTSDLAARALAAMGDIPDANSRIQGEVALQDVAEHADLPQEQALAACCVNAAAGKVSLPTACQVLKIALSALAAGVPGPVSAALAQAGLKALDAARDAKEGRYLGYAFLEAVAGHKQNDAASIVAQAANDASGRRLAQESGYMAQVEALTMLATGNSRGVENDLAWMGKQLAAEVTDVADAREIGYQLLDAMRQKGTGLSTQLADVAYEASSAVMQHPSGRNVQQEAFQFLLDNPAGLPEHAVARYALNASRVGANTEDCHTIGTALLEVMQKHTANDGEAAVMGAARELSAGLSPWGGLQVARLAFQTAADGVDDAPDGALAQMGKAVPTLDLSTDDARAVGATLLHAIAETAQDKTCRKLASRAEGAVSSVPSQPSLWMRLRGHTDSAAEVRRLQQEGFQAVLQRAAEVAEERRAERARKLREEITHMAQGLEQKPAEDPGKVQVNDDGSVNIGGLKVDRKKDPAPSQKGDR